MKSKMPSPVLKELYAKLGQTHPRPVCVLDQLNGSSGITVFDAKMLYNVSGKPVKSSFSFS